MKSMPKIFEYHIGSRDMIQSNAGMEIVIAQTTRPGADSLARRACRAGSPVSSCSLRPGVQQVGIQEPYRETDDRPAREKAAC